MRIILLLFMITPALAFSFQIKGRVFRSDTREGISAAAVLLKSGTNVVSLTQAEDNGAYTIDAAAGDYTVEARSGGFYTESRTITVKSDKTLNFYLVPQSALSLGEVDVVGERLKDTASKNVINKGLREKAPASITGDPLHSMTLMPGVADLGFGGNQGNSRLSVRGGAGNENLAMMDEAMVMYPYHHFLPDSVFIDDIVDSIVLYKGVIPARYGQAMSSLLEVNSIEGKPGFHGKVDIGLLNSSVSVSGATEDQKWNYVGGIRRTYYDLVLPLFIQNTGFTTNINFPYYLDSHGRVRYKDGDDSVSFVWLFSMEPTSYSNISFGRNSQVTNSGLMNYIDGMINLDWKHRFDKEWFIDQSIGTLWAFQDQENNGTLNNIVRKDEEQNIRYKILAGYAPMESLSFNIGSEIIYYPDALYTNYASYLKTNTSGAPEWITLNNNTFNGRLGVYSFFLENETSLFEDHIYFQDGLRFNYVDLIKKTSLDPRLTAGYRFTPDNKIYASAGYLSEFPTDAWSLRNMDTNANLDIPACWHYVLGIQLGFQKTYDASLEFYDKVYDHYLSLESNSEYLLHTSGEQRQIYGVDFLLSKKPDSIPLYGWVSISCYFINGYRTEGIDPNTSYNSDGFFGGSSPSSAQPPQGKWFDPGSLPYKLDMTGIWDINKNWSLTSEFQWQAGSQYTPLKSVQQSIVGTYTNYIPVWGDYNSARLPDVHSLNLKMEYFGTLFDLPFGAYLQVNNVYNYRPVQAVSYNSDYSQKREQISPIGIYPSLGVWMKW